jgi:2-C-methyl-D-erythritol 4-phosphate cytidylyltransferase
LLSTIRSVSASKVCVILVAAGTGERLGAGMPKAFAPLCGESLLTHALRGVLGCADVEHVVIVAPAPHLDQCRDVADKAHVAFANGDHPGRDGALPQLDVAVGGMDRSASVKAGLAMLSEDDAVVLVHDVARCLAPADLFTRIIQAVREGHAAVVPGLPVTDTVKIVDSGGLVQQTLDRPSLRIVQTPQGFLREVLEDAHADVQANVRSAAGAGGGSAATDDAGLVERTGGKVRVVAGDPRALKITTPLDLALATALLRNGRDDG